MISAFNKFLCFTKDLVDGKHNFLSHTYKIMMTGSTPLNTMTVKSDITEIAAVNGYPAGGLPIVMSTSVAAGVAKVGGTDTVFTATGGSFPTVTHAVIYNDTSPTKPLVAFYPYGIPIVVNDTETFTVRFDASTGIFTVT